MISAIEHSGKGKTMETVRRPVVVRGEGGGRVEQVEYREFLGSKTILYTIMDLLNPQNVQDKEQTLMQTIAWVIMMCQCRFTDCNKCTTLEWGC